MVDELLLVQCDRARKYVAPTWEYLEAFCIVNEVERRELHLTSVKLFLLGQALEVAMKGWLVLKEGTSVNDLKRRYGHDLDKLAVAVERYFPGIAPWRRHIAHINASYAGRDYQYPEGSANQAAILGLAEFAQMIKDCHDQLSAEIQRDRHAAGLRR